MQCSPDTVSIPLQSHSDNDEGHEGGGLVHHCKINKNIEHLSLMPTFNLTSITSLGGGGGGNQPFLTESFATSLFPQKKAQGSKLCVVHLNIGETVAYRVCYPSKWIGETVAYRVTLSSRLSLAFLPPIILTTDARCAHMRP